MAEPMMSFADVTRELGVSDAELKSMVAENQIRAFHEGGELLFKREDVAKLKESLETAPTIVLSDTEAESILEDSSVGDSLLDDSLLEEPVLEDAGLEEPLLDDVSLEDVSLEEPVFDEPLLADGLEDDVLSSEETVLSVDGLLEDDGLSIDGGDSLLEDDDFGGAPTSVGDDTVLDSGLLDDEDLSLGLDETEDDDLLGDGERAGPRRVAARPQESSPVMTALMVVMAAALVLPGAILINLAGGDHGVFPGWITENLTFLNGAIDGIISLF